MLLRFRVGNCGLQREIVFSSLKRIASVCVRISVQMVRVERDPTPLSRYCMPCIQYGAMQDVFPRLVLDALNSLLQQQMISAMLSIKTANPNLTDSLVV